MVPAAALTESAARARSRGKRSARKRLRVGCFFAGRFCFAGAACARVGALWGGAAQGWVRFGAKDAFAGFATLFFLSDRRARGHTASRQHGTHHTRERARSAGGAAFRSSTPAHIQEIEQRRARKPPSGCSRRTRVMEEVPSARFKSEDGAILCLNWVLFASHSPRALPARSPRGTPG